MSKVNYLIVDPNQSYISPSATSSVEDNEGWIVINGSTVRITTQRTPGVNSVPGEICFGVESGIPYLYFSPSANTWTKSPISVTPIYDSIRLATSGGTQSPLNYYEEGSFSITWSGSNSSTETFRFTRIGNMVALQALDLNSTGAAGTSIVSTNQIPSRLRPSTQQQQMIVVRDSGALLTTPGILQIATNGTLTIFKTALLGLFLGLGTGHNPISITYLI